MHQSDLLRPSGGVRWARRAACILLVCCAPVWAAESLEGRIDEVLASHYLKKSTMAVRVVELPTGRVLYERHADEPMIPASNVKLVTTSAAMDLLGPTWRFRTRVAVRGHDMLLVGGGDPTISARFSDGDPSRLLDKWVTALREKGVARVPGDLVFDDGFFDDQFRHPSWPKSQFHRWYCAPVGALSLNDNCIDVHVTPGAAPGDPVAMTVVPAGPYAAFENQLTTGGPDAANEWVLLRVPGKTTVVAKGTITREQSSEITVDDPGLFFALTFAEALKRQGVTLAGKVRRERGAGAGPGVHVVLTHETPLVTAIVVANKESQGFYAEQILKTLGAQLTRPAQPGSWATGLAQAARFLAKVGIAADAFVLDDGSGLSRKNQFTAHQFTDILTYVFRQPYGRQFMGTLPVGGVDGTLEHRLRGETVKGRVFAKTGYIAGVRALSGYIWTHHNTWLAFSILGNNVGSHGKVAADQICTILCGQP